jgi:hypothetical protein
MAETIHGRTDYESAEVAVCKICMEEALEIIAMEPKVTRNTNALR